MNQSFKKNLLALGVAAAIGASSSAYAQLASETNATGAITSPPLLGGAVVLFDQTDSPDGNGIPDQDFEAAYDTYDAMGADDFVVNDASGWTVTGVSTIGTTGTPGGSTVTITFYPDAGGTPDVANPVCTFADLVPVDTAGAFELSLTDGGCPLTSDGTDIYWMSQFTNQNFGTNGQHFWSGRSVVDGSESQWINPGDGFGSGCTTFMPAGTVCGVGGGAAQDRLFSLAGTIGAAGALPPVPAVPTFNRWGTAILALGLLAVGMLVRRRRTQ